MIQFFELSLNFRVVFKNFPKKIRSYDHSLIPFRIQGESYYFLRFSQVYLYVTSKLQIVASNNFHYYSIDFYCVAFLVCKQCGCRPCEPHDKKYILYIHFHIFEFGAAAFWLESDRRIGHPNLARVYSAFPRFFSENYYEICDKNDARFITTEEKVEESMGRRKSAIIFN